MKHPQGTRERGKLELLAWLGSGNDTVVSQKIEAVCPTIFKCITPLCPLEISSTSASKEGTRPISLPSWHSLPVSSAVFQNMVERSRKVRLRYGHIDDIHPCIFSHNLEWFTKVHQMKPKSYTFGPLLSRFLRDRIA